MTAASATRIIALVFALTAGVWFVVVGRSHEDESSDRAAPDPSSSGWTSLRTPIRGLAIQIHTAADAEERYGRLIDELAGLGADSVLISINGYQEHVDSAGIFAKASATPTDDQLATLIDHAHQRGLRVILMPKILLSDPRGNNWRGKIQPPSWDAWFQAYRTFILGYAALAERCDVEVFIVGSELISTEKLTDHWRETIRQVRAAYGGLLAYSANWDHYTAVQFWDALDLVGMTTYHKLADEPGPSVAALAERWSELRGRILDFQKTVDRPLLFTEVGWCSQEGCSVEAWNYYRSDQATVAGLEEQRRNYQAFIEAWRDESAVGGVVWWEWTEGGGGPSDCGYTPRGKPAEVELRSYFRETASPGAQ